MRTLSLLKKILLPIGLVVIAVLALMSSTSPVAKSTAYAGPTFSTLISAAMSDFSSNEANASSAPQQQVVAGWATKDLLSVVGTQNVSLIDGVHAVNDNVSAMLEASKQDRTGRLIMLAILAICWIGVWTVVPTTRRPEEPQEPETQPVSPIEA